MEQGGLLRSARVARDITRLQFEKGAASLTDLLDDWKTGQPIPEKSRAIALKGVTIYTSLESCAQCSGVMSLGRVKQVVYLQNDPGAYRIGNIMYNLAGNEPPDPDGDGSALAALPIAATIAARACAVNRSNTGGIGPQDGDIYITLAVNDASKIGRRSWCIRRHL